MGNVVRWLFSPELEVRRWERWLMTGMVLFVALNIVVQV